MKETKAQLIEALELMQKSRNQWRDAANQWKKCFEVMQKKHYDFLEKFALRQTIPPEVVKLGSEESKPKKRWFNIRNKPEEELKPPTPNPFADREIMTPEAQKDFDKRYKKYLDVKPPTPPEGHGNWKE